MWSRTTHHLGLTILDDAYLRPLGSERSFCFGTGTVSTDIGPKENKVLILHTMT